jgi:hypothetical protein
MSGTPLPNPDLALTLQRISNSNERGKAIVALIVNNQIHERHHPLILGLFTVYSLLESMGHFPISDSVSWPPHSDFKRDEWLSIGFNQEAVDILELLPYFKESVVSNYQPEIAHDAPGLSYLGKGMTAYRGISETGQFLDPRDFFVTGDGSEDGTGMFGPRNTYYLYRSEDGW